MNMNFSFSLCKKVRVVASNGTRDYSNILGEEPYVGVKSVTFQAREDIYKVRGTAGIRK